jgi:Uncharacterized conserved protein (DUF2045)
VDWEETIYLNLIVHLFDYKITLAICTRTSPSNLQVSSVQPFCSVADPDPVGFGPFWSD